jgi:Carboxypeptidase regulatory-like domain
MLAIEDSYRCTSLLPESPYPLDLSYLCLNQDIALVNPIRFESLCPSGASRSLCRRSSLRKETRLSRIKPEGSSVREAGRLSLELTKNTIGDLMIKICSAILLSLLFVGSLSAQTFRGTILGTVTDATGAPIPAAKVTVHSAETGIDRQASSGQDGTYSIPELPIGAYNVTVEKEGFATFMARSVSVNVASQARVDAALHPGSVRETVEISADALPQVETTSDTLGATLTSKEVQNLPINGRDYTKLIYLTPGISGSPDQITDSPGSYGTFSMNGARGRSNNFLLDGTDMNDGFRNDPAVNQPGVFGAPATILPVDAVQDLNVMSNFQPEYGRSAGAVINIVTKSGTNKFHGTAFEYFRNNALDARNYFNEKGNLQAPFHNNQFGGSLGGPIVRDKTFFFVDYEGQREAVGTVSLASVPDPAVLATATNPVIRALLQRKPWPQPNANGSIVAPSNNYIQSVIAKIDQNLPHSNLLSGRYYFGDSTQSFPLALSGGGVLPGFNTSTPTRVQLVSISDVAVLRANKVNEIRIGWNRFAEGFFPQDGSFAPSSIGLNTGTGVANKGLPVMVVNGYSSLGASKSDPRSRVDSNWQAFDNFSWNLGRHDVKLGYESRRTTIQQFLGTNFRGKLTFATLNDFLAGNVAGGSQSTGYSTRHSAVNSHGLYVQDAYRALPHLTLNFGMRWDYYGVIGEKNNLMSNITSFDPAAGTLTLSMLGSSSLKRLYQPDYTNFSPRVSVAWDILGSGKTVLRTGYGIFFDSFSQDVFLAHLPFNSSFDPGPAYNPIGPAPIYSVSAVGGTIVSGQPVFNTAGGTPAGDIFGVDRNMTTPYMQNFNLNLQQQLTSKTVLQVGYVGSLGRHLLHFRDLNQPGQTVIAATDLAYAQTASYSYQDTEGNTVTGPCVNNGVVIGGPGCIPGYNSASRVYPNNPYGAFYVNQEEAKATSNYNALQASLRTTSWHGVTSILNYSWAHSLDTASDSEDFIPNAAQPTDSTNTRREYGNSNFDIRNRVTWIFSYALPDSSGDLAVLRNGWGLDSTVSRQTGQPFSLNYNFQGDFSGSGQGFDRPDIIGHAHYSGNPAKFLDLSSFAIPCTATSFALAGNVQGTEQDCLPGTRHFGSLSRNSLRGLPYTNWDMALYKSTHLGEHVTMQLRAEIFNVVNHPNFSSPELPNFIADAAPNGLTNSGNHVVSAGAYPITATGDVGIGNPFLGGGGPRGIQLAAKFSF